MKLQKMHYEDCDNKVVCAVDEFHAGGEFTMCGNAIISHDKDVKVIGRTFRGTFGDITCRKCAGFIAYVKGLK